MGDVAATAPAGAEPVQHRRVRRQTSWRRWRKTRPFWGGLLTMLGGIEIAYVTGSAYKLLLVSKSVTVAIVIGVVIAVFGLTMWLAPEHNKLLGLLTLVAALVSLVMANLGGFLVGMLLAIAGGGLSFAWLPGARPVPAVAPEAVPEPDESGGLEILIPEQPAVLDLREPAAPAELSRRSQDPPRPPGEP